MRKELQSARAFIYALECVEGKNKKEKKRSPTVNVCTYDPIDAVKVVSGITSVVVVKCGMLRVRVLSGLGRGFARVAVVVRRVRRREVGRCMVVELVGWLWCWLVVVLVDRGVG